MNVLLFKCLLFFPTKMTQVQQILLSPKYCHVVHVVKHNVQTKLQTLKATNKPNDKRIVGRAAVQMDERDEGVAVQVVRAGRRVGTAVVLHQQGEDEEGS